MPDSGPVNALRARLAGAMALNHSLRDLGWGDTKAMKASLADVRRVFGGGDDTARPARNDLVDAVRQFFRDQQAGTFTQLKYVCYGVTVPVDADGQRLIDRGPLFTRLLELVEQRQGQPKQFRRCYQGLMSGYFGFSGASTAAAGTTNNWLTLRGFLGSRLEPVAASARTRGREPAWLDTLARHSNLLGDKPCVRYADALRRGDRSELAGVCKGLDIQSDSWVWHEAVMAYVRDVVRADDPSFQSEVPKVLPVIDGQHADLQLPHAVAREASALVVARYAKCRDRPERSDLRDICLRRIGNPWLERAAWDAFVEIEPARQMIESWLKRRLIKDFFELLAHDGAADLRRLNYWLKWEPHINDMWFVLGGDARFNRGAEFLQLRKRMAGRERTLAGQTDLGNNAFIMRIGPLLVIEFGKTNNACFLYQAADFKGNLEISSLSINTLKQRTASTRMSHNGPWEIKFDETLRQQLGSAPLKVTILPAVQADGVSSPIQRFSTPDTLKDTTLTESAIVALPSNPRELDSILVENVIFKCRRYCVEYDDQLINGGRFWIRLSNPESAPELAQMAREYGFAFIKGEGFYVDSTARSLAIPETHAVTGPANTQKLGAQDLYSLQQVCRTFEIPFLDLRKDGGGIWVKLLQESERSGLVARLRDLGFVFHAGEGFYLSAAGVVRDDDVNAVTQAKPVACRKFHDSSFETLRKICNTHSIPLVDLRGEGGALWVKLLSERSHLGLVAFIKDFGFVFQVGKGYYLDPGN